MTEGAAESGSGPAKALKELREELADAVLERYCQRYPRDARRMDEPARQKCRRDLVYHFMYLSDAVEAHSPLLFLEYVRWVKRLFSSLGVSNESFRAALELMEEVIGERRDALGAGAAEHLRQAAEHFPGLAEREGSYIDLEQPLGPLAKAYLKALLNRRRQRAMELVLKAVERGTDIRDIYEQVFQVTQWEIGRLWQENEVSVAQEHYCTAATQLVMSRLYPYIFRQRKRGLVFVGSSVGDELHELGIRMITDFLELEGWDTHFLGANMPADSLLQTIAEEEAQVVGISVTITHHIDRARQIIADLRSRPELRGVKVLAGGYPFNLDPELWRKIGADGTASTAREAVRAAEELVNGDRDV